MTDYNVQVKVDPNQASRGIDQIHSKLTSLEEGANRLQELMTKVFAFAGITVGFHEFVELADDFAMVENNLRQVTDSAELMNLVLEKLYDMSQKTGTSFVQNSDMFRLLAKSASTAGVSLKELLEAQENLDKLSRLNNMNLDQASESYLSLSRAMLKGTVNSRDFMTLLRQMPDVVRVLSESLGVPVAKLKMMASQGQITGKQLLDAIGGATEQIDKKFNQLTPTIERSTTVLKNAFIHFIGEVDSSNGIVATFANLVMTLAANMEVLSKAIALVALTIAVELGSKVYAMVVASTSLITVIALIAAALFIFSDKISFFSSNTSKQVITLYDVIAVTFGEMYKLISKIMLGLWTGVSNVFNALVGSAGSFDQTFGSSFLEFTISQVNIFLSLMADSINAVGKLTHMFNPDSYSPVTAPNLPNAQAMRLQAERRAQNNAIAQAQFEAKQKALEKTLEQHGSDQSGSGLERINKALKDQKELLKGIVVTSDEYKQTMDDLNVLLNAGKLSAFQYAEALEKLHLKMLETDKTMQGGLAAGLLKIKMQFTDIGKLVSDSLVNGFKNAEDALVNFVTTGKLSLSSFFKSLEADMARIAIRQQITGPLATLMGSIGSSMASSLPSISALFGGARAAGGDVFGGTSYMVGEHGPELWTAPSNGTIVPNHALGGGGNVTVNVTNNSSNSQATTTTTKDGRGNKTIDIMIDEITAANIRSSGSKSSKAMRDTFGISPSTVAR